MIYRFIYIFNLFYKKHKYYLVFNYKLDWNHIIMWGTLTNLSDRKTMFLMIKMITLKF